MKKTFLKTVVATAAVVGALALSCVSAFAAEKILFDGTTSSAALAEGVTSNPAISGDSKGSEDGTFNFTKRIKISNEDSNYIKFEQDGNFTLKLHYRVGGTGARSILLKNSADDATYSLLNETIPDLSDKTYVRYIEIDIEGEDSKPYYMLTVSKEISFYYVAIEEADSVAYPTFAASNTDAILDAGKSATATLDADITNLTAGDTTGTVDNLADTTTIPGFTVIGSTSTDDTTGEKTFKGMTIEGNSKNFAGVSYSNRLKTNGVGSTEKYAIKFTVDKDSTVEIIGMSGNSASTRPVVIANGSGVELASHEFVGSTMSKGVFSVTAGTYYLYAGPCTEGSDGGINIYDIKVYDGVTYKLPVVELENAGATSGTLSLVATVNSDYTAGEVTGIGFILAKPNDTATTTKACTYYTINADGNYEFTGNVSEQNLKAQAYVVYTSLVDGSSVTRYSNTVTNEVVA